MSRRLGIVGALLVSAGCGSPAAAATATACYDECGIPCDEPFGLRLDGCVTLSLARSRDEELGRAVVVVFHRPHPAFDVPAEACELVAVDAVGVARLSSIGRRVPDPIFDSAPASWRFPVVPTSGCDDLRALEVVTVCGHALRVIERRIAPPPSLGGEAVDPAERAVEVRDASECARE